MSGASRSLKVDGKVLEGISRGPLPASRKVYVPGERYPELRVIAERLAKEYGLGMAEYFGERREDPQYEAAPPSKGDSLTALVRRLTPGVTLLVTHVGLDDAELGALVDMNTDGGLPEMSRNRQGELDALMSGPFRDAVKSRDVTLISYRQLIEKHGLQSMRRPREE